MVDKCLDKLEEMVVYNLTEPEKRKLSFLDRWFESQLKLNKIYNTEVGGCIRRYTVQNDEIITYIKFHV